MNPEERLNLQKMIAVNDVTDQTDNIRKLRHSDRIWKDVQLMLLLKKKHSRIIKTDTFKSLASKQCKFLFNNYTDIYNKLIKDELNVTILFRFIQELKRIEMGEVDQHEASFKIGTLLKELYVDAALKKAETLDKHGKKIQYRKNKKITWNNFKQMDMNDVTEADA